MRGCVRVKKSPSGAGSTLARLASPQSLFDYFTAHYNSCRGERRQVKEVGFQLHEWCRLVTGLEGEVAAGEDGPWGATGEPCPLQAAGGLLWGFLCPLGALGILLASLSKSLVKRVSPKGLRCYGTVIHGLKPGSRWRLYVDRTCWVPARDLGVLFVITCRLSDGNVSASAGPPCGSHYW